MSENITHWLETAYSRICAGEGEANVLRDYGLMREEAFLMGVGHLKFENERLADENKRFVEQLSQAMNQLNMTIRDKT